MSRAQYRNPHVPSAVLEQVQEHRRSSSRGPICLRAGTCAAGDPQGAVCHENAGGALMVYFEAGHLNVSSNHGVTLDAVILVPAYNASKTIRETLRSLQANPALDCIKAV